MKRLPDPRRRTPLMRVFFSVLATVLVLVTLAAAAGLWALDEVRAPGPLDEPKAVVIERGQRTPEIGETLARHGVVSDHRLFTAAAYLTRPTAGNLKAGEYEFPAGASIVQVLAIIRTGRPVVHKLTVPEGVTTAQVVQRVLDHAALSGSITEIPPEGSLLPDTYVFQRGLDRQALLDRMREAQAKLLDSLWERRAPDLPLASKEEAVILASIVEKETGVPEERRQVAAVFINRLKKNMRLQSDPTIIYGIVGGRGRLDRPILKSDIETRTEYNTYRIDGLPPTPIANPGRESLLAVLMPADTDDLYFVADGTGGHAFARTLEEHRQNVRKWRKIELETNAEEEASNSEEAAEPVAVEAAAPAVEQPATQAEQSAAAPAVEQPAGVVAEDAADSTAGAPTLPVPGNSASGEHPPAPASGAEKPQTSEPGMPSSPQEAESSGESQPAEERGPAAARSSDSATQLPQPSAPPAAPATAAPVPKAKPDPAVQVAKRLVPVPRPKPKRN